MKSFSQFEESVGLDFKDKDLLKQAFTHRSYINENKSFKNGHNERLEFLGDAILELIVTDFLYNKYKDKTEGDLTSIRSALVNANTCSLIASKLGFNDFLLLSRGESKDLGKARVYILANALEALIGAIYIDQGYEAAKDFVLKHVSPLTEKVVSEGLWMDAKSNFQERSQEILGITPSYRTLEEVGPDHDKKFTVGVFLGSELVAKGSGHSKQEAEQASAREALRQKGWL